jgi:hypothetical protein
VADDVRKWLADGARREPWVRLSNPKHPYKFVIRHVLTAADPVLAKFDRDLFHRE